MKVCAGCNIEMELSEFRVRIDKRHQKPNGLTYYNNVCYKCEAARQKLRTQRQRKTPEGRAMHNRWAREFYHRHTDKCKNYNKKRRDSEHGKAIRKKYDFENKEKIASQNLLRNKKYTNDLIKNIKPAYIVRLMAHPGVGLDEHIVRSYPEFIKTYQQQIAFKRLIKTKNNEQWKISYNSERLL